LSARIFVRKLFILCRENSVSRELVGVRLKADWPSTIFSRRQSVTPFNRACRNRVPYVLLTARHWFSAKRSADDFRARSAVFRRTPFLLFNTGRSRVPFCNANAPNGVSVFAQVVVAGESGNENPFLALTSAGGLPPSDTHSSSTGTFSAAVTVSPCTIRGRSGATSTVSVAFLDRMAGSSRLPTPTWHWYTPSSSSVTGLTVRLYSPGRTKNANHQSPRWTRRDR
jgi:hypothetical protein